MAELKFGIYGDSTSFKKALEEATKGVTQAKTKIESEGKSMSSVFDSLKKATTGLGVAFGLNELKNLGVQIAKTRSDFQQLEVSFKTMLGSGEKANAMLKQLTTTAATTPFGLQEVAGGAKQLLAYGIEAEKVNDMLIRLGDIASGLSIPLNDLVYLYGTTMTQGRMFTQDLRQFQGRGIPIADELAKQFGIAKSQVGEFVTAGKVGAKEVEQAIINMTSAGSQFGGLMKAQSETIGGRWSNIEDQIDMAFNEIGQNSEGFINGFLDSINYLIENYKTIGTYLGGIIASYGVWKATLLAHNAISKTMADGEVANLTKIAKANLDVLKAKEQRLNLEMEEADKNNDVDKYVELGTQKEALAKQIETAEEQLNTLAKTQNTTATQANAVATTTNATTTKASTIATKSNTLAVKAQNLAYGLGVKALGLFKGAWNALKTAFMSNPIGMIAVGITSVITLISAWRGKQDEMNKSLEEGKEKAKSYFDALKQEGGTIKSYVSTIRDKNANDLEQIKAYRELMKLVPEITNQYTQQELAALNATKAEELLTEAINNREIARAKKAGQLASSISTQLDNGKKWEDFTPEERKFLSGEMQMDKEFISGNPDKAKIQLREVAKEANVATNNLTQLNKIAELQNMKSGEEKIKALSKEMANLGQKKELIDEFSKTLTTYGENIGTIGASMPLDKLQKDLIPKIKEQFGIDFNLYDLIEHNWSGGIDESGTQSKIKQFLETYFGGIAEEIKANYKMLDDEINKESGIGIEVNPYLNMNETQLNESLEKIEGDINDKLRIIQQNEELEKIVILNADIQDAKAQEAYNTALAQLDANAKALGQDRYVSSNVEFNAVVTPRFVLGNTQNETPFPTQDLLNRPFNQWLPTGNINTSTNQELQIMVQTQQQEIQKLKEQLNSKKTTPTTPTKTKKSGGGKGKSQAELNKNLEKAEKDLEEAQLKIAEERNEALIKLDNDLTQARIDIQEDGIKKRKEQHEHDAELERIEWEKSLKEEIQAEKERQKQLFEAEQKVEKAKAEKSGKTYTEKVWDEETMLNTTEIDKINAKYQALMQARLSLQAQQNKAFNDEERKAQDEYLKQYGTYLEKVDAITRLYNDKIKSATTEGERKSLEKQRDEEISNINKEYKKDGINWDDIFGDTTNRSLEGLQRMHSAIRDLILSNKDLSAEDIAKLYDQYNKVGDAIDDSTTSFAEFVGWNDEAKEKAERLKKEYEETKVILDELKKKRDELSTTQKTTQQDLVKFMKETTGVDIKGDESEYTLSSMLEGQSDETIAKFKDLYKANKDATNELATTTENVSIAEDKVSKAQKTMEETNKTSKDKNDKFIESMNKVVANFQSMGQLMDELGLSGSPVAKSLGHIADSASMATQAFSDLKSGNFVGAIANSLGALRSLGDALGALGIKGFGSSDINLHEDLEKLAKENEALTHAMEELSDVMENASIAGATDAFLKSTEYLNQSIKNTQEQMERSARASSAGFLGIGSRRSSAGKVTEGISTQEWGRVSKIVGQAVNSGTDFFNITSEQMAKVARDAPDIYARIKDLADDGYENASQYMDEYIQYYKELEEVENQWREKVTSNSFDSIASDFESALLDMETSTEDFANTFEELMAKAIIGGMMADKYEGLLNEWYKDFADYMSNDGTLDSTETKELQERYAKISKDALKERDAILEASGVSLDGSSTSSSSNRGIESMTQQETEELNGRFTALQIAGEGIRQQSAQTNALLMALTSQIAPCIATSAESSNTLYELRELAISRNGYLSDISDYTKNLVAIKKTLSNIETNTQNL